MRYRTRRRRGFIIPAAIFFLGLGVALSWNSQSSSRDFLVRKGYTQIHMTGLQLWSPMCVKGSLGQGFTALGPEFQRTNGYVCYSPVWSYVALK